jgi:hypothetical protein
MTRGHAVCGLSSYGTGDKTGKDDGEDGCVDEKFHDWLPPGGVCFVSVWKRGTIKSIVRKIRECVFLSTYRGYLLSTLPKYLFQLFQSTPFFGYFGILQKTHIGHLSTGDFRVREKIASRMSRVYIPISTLPGAAASHDLDPETW